MAIIASALTLGDGLNPNLGDSVEQNMALHGVSDPATSDAVLRLPYFQSYAGDFRFGYNGPDEDIVSDDQADVTTVSPPSTHQAHRKATVIQQGVREASVSKFSRPEDIPAENLPNYKTRMCPFTIAGEVCPYHDHCSFAHSEDEKRYNPFLKTKVCRRGLACPHQDTTTHDNAPRHGFQHRTAPTRQSRGSGHDYGGLSHPFIPGHGDDDDAYCIQE